MEPGGGSACESQEQQDQSVEARAERLAFQQKYEEFQEFCKRRDSIHARYRERLELMRTLLRLRELRCEKALRGDANEVAKALAGGVDVGKLERKLDESEATMQRLMDSSADLFNLSLSSHSQVQQRPSTEHDAFLREFCATWQYPWPGNQEGNDEGDQDGSGAGRRPAFDEPEDALWWQQWERYNKANMDGLSFAEVRRQWDRYARPRVSPGALPGVLPRGTVSPAPPSSPLWRACLVDPSVDTSAVSSERYGVCTGNWMRMVLPDC